MRLIQFVDEDGRRRVACIAADGRYPRLVKGATSTRDLALESARGSETLLKAVMRRGLGDAVDYDAIIREKRILPPLDHPDSHRCIIAVTGLTHTGSAKSRDAMHAKLQAADLSDSMKMFKLGVEGGKPSGGDTGVQPEWAYKGDGSWVVPPEQAFDYPTYAEDAGDEAEVVGLYVIGDSGEVLRVGFALGNEYSDHVMERRNYLYLAHSKLRQCSYGPELLLGELPENLLGTSKVQRNGQVLWSSEFCSGEENMVHSIANLEHHHFKYEGFRQPGDVHVYFFGASVFSFSDGIKVEAGDSFEVDCPLFGRPLRNGIVSKSIEEPAVRVRVL
jgi:hypothetical protein